MKRLATIILLLLLTGNAVAKRNSIDRGQLINKEWIGPGGEYINVKDDSALFQTQDIRGKTIYTLRDSLLVLTQGSGIYSHNDTFIIDKLNKDTLVLRSVIKTYSKPGIYYSGSHDPLRTGDPVVFVNRAILYDPSFKFEKIFFSFHGGLGAGMCMGSDIMIDSSGTVLIAIGPGKCGGYNGTYKGMLSAAEAKRLNGLVSKSLPERFAMGHSGTDGGQTVYKIYYNNKAKEMSGAGVPYLALDLQTFLNGWPWKTHFDKISDDTRLAQ